MRRGPRRRAPKFESNYPFVGFAAGPSLRIMTPRPRDRCTAKRQTVALPVALSQGRALSRRARRLPKQFGSSSSWSGHSLWLSIPSWSGGLTSSSEAMCHLRAQVTRVSRLVDKGCQRGDATWCGGEPWPSGPSENQGVTRLRQAGTRIALRNRAPKTLLGGENYVGVSSCLVGVWTRLR